MQPNNSSVESVKSADRKKIIWLLTGSDNGIRGAEDGNVIFVPAGIIFVSYRAWMLPDGGSTAFLLKC
jgi:hypothetical protein